jgi:L-amino acid N-acyltransferase YncA
MASNIRQATREDLPSLMVLAKEAEASTSYKGTGFSQQHCWENMERALENNWYCAVMPRDGAIVGALFGYLAQGWHTLEMLSNVPFFYVQPAHRGGRAPLYMVYNFIQWCQDNGANQIRVGIDSGCMAGDTLFRRLGFTPVGYQYIYQGE